MQAQARASVDREYSLEGAKPSDRVSITLKRSDLTLHAPGYVPNKF